MRLLRFCLFCFVTLSGETTLFSQAVKEGPSVPAGFCISSQEMKLYNMINEYRNRFDLPPVPLSKSLCFVASSHVKDLFFHHPDHPPCNFHSWSDKGPWKPFCYPRDENKKNSVWDKPKELTKYKGKGFEIVYWENNPVNIDSIIPFWKSIDYFNGFLMNTGKWEGKKWNAIGIAIYENYASAWFGEIPDTTGEPVVCGSIVRKKPGAVTESQKDEKAPVPPQPAKKKAEKTAKPIKQQQLHTDSLKSDLVKHKQPTPDSVKSEPVKHHKPHTDSVKSVPVEIVRARTEKLYIIVQSLLPLTQLKKTAESLKSQGYADAKILEKDRKFRVSIMEFDVKIKADSALREVKKLYQDAWLLKY